MDDHRSERLVWAGSTALATSALYLVLLGWHAQSTLSPRGRGECTGPYEPWQVAGLVAGLVVVVGVASWLGHAWSAVPSSVVCLTALWSFDAATVDGPCRVGASLWPVGAALLFVGSALGLGVVAALAALGGKLLRRRDLDASDTTDASDGAGRP